MIRLCAWGKALLIASSLLFSTAHSASPSSADDFPSQPIQLYVPFNPGGSVDVTTRALGRAIEKELPGTTVVVVNRPGAGGSIALGQVARANPDGYTLGVFVPPNAVIAPQMQDVPYDALQDFSYVAHYGVTTLYVAVPADSPYRTLDDLLDDMQAHPGKVMIGVTTLGSTPHLATARMLKDRDLTSEYVAYGGGAQIITAMLGNQVPVAALAGEAIPHVLSGKIRFLASYSADKVSAVQDVPSIREFGFEWNAESWTGLVAPTGLDEGIRQKLETAVMQATKDPDFQKTMESMATIVKPMTGSELQHLLEQSHKDLTPLIKDAGLAHK